ncbi:MAG: hypothetical protein HRU18_03080 [Pseudoalteromonas sp.]|uniref:hypothetical protein n=1 Tax=Pseudoalteromonas sp. TaxID=53249 RepID=UPI001D69F899|nr:hypothetical protein [Pseudoalteromonas sp.]NRA77168.1 hypothetical protein [Pseudoalteromonas sp.]
MLECHDKYHNVLRLNTGTQGVPAGTLVPHIDLAKHRDKLAKLSSQYTTIITVENVPISQLYVGRDNCGSIDHRDATISILDPRGFALRVPVGQFIKDLKHLTVINGYIQEELIWGNDAGSPRLFIPGSELHTTAVSNVKGNTKGNYITPSKLKRGDVVEVLNDGRQFTFLGMHKCKIEILTKESPMSGSHARHIYIRVTDPVVNTQTVTDTKWIPVYESRNTSYKVHYITPQKVIKVIKNVEVKDEPLPNNILGYEYHPPNRIAMLNTFVSGPRHHSTYNVVGSTIKKDPK